MPGSAVGPRPSADARSRRSTAAVVGLAAIALLAGHVAIVRGATRAKEDPWRAASYVQWDAYRYLDVARRGYVEIPGDRPASNTGWFPGYPLALRALRACVHVKPAVAARTVSVACTFVLFVLIAVALPPGLSGPRRVLAALLAAVFPGWVYLHAAFPQAMLCATTMAALLLAAAGRWTAAGLAGGISAFTYPTGVLVAAPLALGAALAPVSPPRRRRVLAALALPGAGLAAVAVLLQAQTRHWDAYLRFQRETYGNAPSLPVWLLGRGVHTWRSPAGGPIVDVQGPLAALLLVAALTVLWHERGRMRLLDLMLAAHGVVVFAAVSMLGPNVSIYRQAVALVGVVPLLARLRLPLLLALTALLAALAPGLAEAFFRAQMV